MSHSRRAGKGRARKTTVLLTAGMLAAVVSCSESTVPTRILTPETASLATGGNMRVKVKTFQLATNTLRIDGPAVAATASVSNSGGAIPSGVSLQAMITQGNASREAANTPLVCVDSPGDVGKLPAGNCDLAVSAMASNSSPGNGTLVPGAATLVLRVFQTINATVTELASKSVAVNLAATPAITSLALVSTTLTIDGPGTSYTTTIHNPANSLQNVLLQGEIVQGETRRAAGGTMVICGSGVGVFPPGTCTITFGAGASNSAGGGGTLVTGPATFELQLIQVSGGVETRFDTETISISLVSTDAPAFVNLTLGKTKIVIDGYSVDYTAELQNAGPPVSGLNLIGRLEQDQGAATVVHGLSGRIIDCGAGAGVLPTTGTSSCFVEHGFAFTPDPGAGALQLGPARVEFDLYTVVAGQTVVLGQQTVNVTLIPAGIRIESMTFASTDVPLEGGIQGSATIYNPGSGNLTLVVVQGYIRQGSADKGAGGREVTCGPASGSLPEGECVQPIFIVASNSSGGTGTLLPGSATYVMELLHFNGTTTTVIDTKSIPINLVATTPIILSVALETNALEIGGARVNYTATLLNPTNVPLTDVGLQAYVDQGTSSMPAGGKTLDCTLTNGQMPVGNCVVSGTAGAVNQSPGVGALVPGPALLRIELWQGTGSLHTFIVPVTLTGPSQ
jgi:hypothetical protein